MEDALTIEPEEAAKILKCTPQKLAEELCSGNLPGAKFGRKWIIPREAFYQRLNEIALERALALRGGASRVLIPKPEVDAPGRIVRGSR